MTRMNRTQSMIAVAGLLMGLAAAGATAVAQTSTRYDVGADQRVRRD